MHGFHCFIMCADCPSSGPGEGTQQSVDPLHHRTRARGLVQSHAAGHSHQRHATARERSSDLFNNISLFFRYDLTTELTRR